jgi:hypothetical protein
VGSDTDSRLRADVVLLASVLAGRRDELAEAMTRRITGAVGVYHALPAREEILQHWGAHLDAMVRAPGLPSGQLGHAVRAVAAAHGRACAGEGMPLAVLVECYRVGLRVLWEAVLQACSGESMPEDELAGATCAVWRLQDVWVQSMTAAHYKESREMILSRDRPGSALVGAVLDGHVEDTGELANTWVISAAESDRMRGPSSGTHSTPPAVPPSSGLP